MSRKKPKLPEQGQGVRMENGRAVNGQGTEVQAIKPLQHWAAVSQAASGARLDAFAAQCAGITRSRMERLIRDGHVRMDGRVVVKPGIKLLEGGQISWEIPPPSATPLMPEPLPLTILYEDKDVAVVFKPCGMVVHPAVGNERGTLVHALLYHLSDLSGIGGVVRPGIVHRLDKDTSGLLLVAKHDAAHQALSAQLKARQMRKIYAALVQGGFSTEAGSIDAPIGRDPRDRKRMAVTPDGRGALTEYRVAGRFAGATLLCVRLITGRTHQIRVHLRSLGHPIMGDPIYGGKQHLKAARLMLHAYRLTFAQPTTGEPVTVTAPWPDDFLKSFTCFVPPPDRKQSIQHAMDDFESLCETF